MTDKEVYLTREGLRKIEEELDVLKSVRRREVAERIKEALSFGDISENSEYDQAKSEQAQLEERILKLENMLRNVRLIEEDEISTDIVSVGSKVTLLDKEFDEEMEYTIVGSAEADPFDGKISNESPLGKSILGSKVGDVLDVNVPDGIIQYEVLKIDR